VPAEVGGSEPPPPHADSKDAMRTVMETLFMMYVYSAAGGVSYNTEPRGRSLILARLRPSRVT
jgi:hypothetical protein